MALTLTIGPTGGSTTDYLPYLDFRSLVVEDSVEVAVDECAFDLWIYSTDIAIPLEGYEVIFKDGSTIEFAGVLIKVTHQYGPTRNVIIHSCTCRDYTWYLNRRLVNDTYTAQAAGQTIKDILTGLFNASESDTHYEFFKDNVGEIEDGPGISAVTFDKITPSQAFDSIAESTDKKWWIDFTKKVNYKDFESVESPLSGNALIVDTDLRDYYNFSEETSIEDIGTKLILRDVSSQSTASHTDTFKMTQEDDDAGKKIFPLSRVPFDLASIASVTLNTGAGAVAQDILAEDIDGSPFGGEGDANDVYRLIRDSGSYIRFSDANTLSVGDVIAVTYKYAVTDDLEGIEASTITNMKQRTGGDGVHEFVYSQSSGLKVTDLDDVDKIENMILLRKSKIIRRGTFRSWVKGWTAGQTFQRIWFSLGLSTERMYVVSVTKVILTPADDPILSDNVIESSIVYANTPRGANV